VKAPPTARRRLPPVDVLAVVSLALVVIGGILMASYVPRRPPLGVPAAVAAVSAALLMACAVLLSRLRQFAWDRFFVAFVRNHTRGAPLALVTVMLVIFALDVPLIIAFTVARFSSPPHSAT
jgi:hypothetical protein